MTLCVCGSNIDERQCCSRYIDGSLQPETAEALMRARYTAYTQANVDFIIASHDAATRVELDIESAIHWSRTANWQGVEILETIAGSIDDDYGIVEFKAYYELDDKPCVLHERSEFKKRNGHWFYLDGQIPVLQYRRQAAKVGRNDPCICGSGKKYKKCCA